MTDAKLEFLREAQNSRWRPKGLPIVIFERFFFTTFELKVIESYLDLLSTNFGLGIILMINFMFGNHLDQKIPKIQDGDRHYVYAALYYSSLLNL